MILRTRRDSRHASPPAGARRPLAAAAHFVTLLTFATALGCAQLRPSNVRDWSPDQAVLPTAEFSDDGRHVTIRNIRACNYRTADDYDVRHYDRTYDLADLKTVDFLRAPFPEAPELAHTMLSFGFADKEYLGVSVEIRKEKGETYNPLLAAANKYEIMYVLGDERDLIGLRTNYRLNDVYLYPTNAKSTDVRRLFDHVMARVNKLAKEPEFYNTLTNNCTTNIVAHVNQLTPGRVPYDWRVLLPGYSDRLAFDLGLLKTELPFEATRAAARVTDVAYQAREAEDFSQAIRRR